MTAIGDQFVRDLRDALNHLYDPPHLRRSPLARQLGLSERLNVYLALQEVLIAAIEALQPPPGDQPRSPRARIHQLLTYRYVRQFDQEEMADLLGVSVRQLAREQNMALEALAGYLSKRYRLEEQAAAAENRAGASRLPQEGSAPAEDLGWAAQIPPGSFPDLAQTLGEVVALVQPLVAAGGVRLEVSPAESAPYPLAHPVALRQMLINVLTDAVQAHPHGSVRVDVQSAGEQVEVRVRGRGGTVASGLPPANSPTTESLARLSGGSYIVSRPDEPFTAALRLRAVQPAAVLVVEDNADTLDLLERYVSGTRFRLITTCDPGAAVALAEQHQPALILLDLMMPQMDGWQVLATLRSQPAAAHIPVVVCSILAQEALALAVGAAAFLRKPFTREAFLAVLDRWAGATASTPL